MDSITMTPIGGPTALIDVASFRLLTDPTFDAPGEYHLPHVTLKKLSGPARGPDDIGHVDAVLLSHDQHADNLDAAGRAFLSKADRVFTTAAGAARLGGNAEGLAPWQSRELRSGNGSFLRITATPARHGPFGIEPLSGEVIGFIVEVPNHANASVYITGDTVWFDGVAEVARRFSPKVVIPFAGAAQTRGPFHLTMDTNDVIETARAFNGAVIAPLHYEGWGHFSQSGDDLRRAFEALGLQDRLRLLQPGAAAELRM